MVVKVGGQFVHTVGPPVGTNSDQPAKELFDDFVALAKSGRRLIMDDLLIGRR
ncbi:hypothetical protein ACRCUN_10830 [Mycobacterium sp. LTG2003]